jgi:hypothetical protein
MYLLVLSLSHSRGSTRPMQDFIGVGVIKRYVNVNLYLRLPLGILLS